MFQVPTGYWQEIAQAHPEMKSRWAKAMAGGQPAIDALIAHVEKELDSERIPNSVILAFEITAPLLIENAAIQAWVRETDNLYLTQTVLLDIGSPEEAATIGAMEYRLTPEDQALLISLLSRELDSGVEPCEDDEPVPREDGYELRVVRAHVIQGLQVLRVPRKLRAHERATLGFDGSFLTVEVFDHMFVAGATGVWPGNARVSAALIAALKHALPAGDPLVVRCDGKRVSVGSMRVDCEWQPVSAALSSAPPVRDWIAAVLLSYSMPRGRIATAGLTREVDDAERKLSQLVKRIAKSLAPLGVTADDVRNLVERRLQERSAGRPPDPTPPS